MKRILFLFVSFFLTYPPLDAQMQPGNNIRISILTCTPSEEAVYTVYGHTAIRVLDPEKERDLVFNYGMFDSSKPNFAYHFAKGETDYKLGVTTFDRFLAEYQMRGSGIIEQVLNLTPKEQKQIWEALVINARPENAVYKYNFFFDNCATRPVAIVEQYVDGEVVYTHKTTPQTFRELINYSMRNKPWLIFGTDLALGSPTDRIATPREEMFLPLYLQAAFDKAMIQNPDGSMRKLISETNILAYEIPEEIEKTLFTPLVCGLLVFFLALTLALYERKTKRYFRWVDCTLFSIAGLAGIVLSFLAFVSEHPATFPNWLLIWLHPFHWVGAVLFAVKKFNKAAYSYHFINFAALTLMLLGWYFIPQHMNVAFIPLIFTLWIRSAFKLTKDS